MLKYSLFTVFISVVFCQDNVSKAPGLSNELRKVILDYGRLIVKTCPPMLCPGYDCRIVTERNGCQLCACPIGSPARGCDPMPFVLWHDLMTKGCPVNGSATHERGDAQKVTRYFRRVNRFTHTDECEAYVFPYCVDLDYNLWRSPRSLEECQKLCYPQEGREDDNSANNGIRSQRRVTERDNFADEEERRQIAA